MNEAQLTKSGQVLPRNKCTVCGYETDAATAAYSQFRPKPGDVTLCLKCGELYVFDEQMKIGTPTLDFLCSLGQEIHDQIDKVQRTIREKRFLS